MLARLKPATLLRSVTAAGTFSRIKSKAGGWWSVRVFRHFQLWEHTKGTGWMTHKIPKPRDFHIGAWDKMNYIQELLVARVYYMIICFFRFFFFRSCFSSASGPTGADSWLWSRRGVGNSKWHGKTCRCTTITGLLNYKSERDHR